jgi:hypothetical protein
VIAAIVVLFTAVVVVTGGLSDDSQSSEEALRDAQRNVIGAEACMPQQVRRRLTRLADHADARFDHVLDRLPSDASRDAERKALSSDRQYVQVTNQMRILLSTYSPGGSRYEKGCYERAIRRFERRNAAESE